MNTFRNLYPGGYGCGGMHYGDYGHEGYGGYGGYGYDGQHLYHGGYDPYAHASNPISMPYHTGYPMSGAHPTAFSTPYPLTGTYPTPMPASVSSPSTAAVPPSYYNLPAGGSLYPYPYQ